MARGDSGETVTVDGHRLRLTHPDKVLYPETGTTKADVLVYYDRVSDALLAQTRGRPATRKRWVDGVGTPGHPGSMFFSKDLERGAPSWVHRRRVEHSDHANDYPLIDDRATLAWCGQVAALELHVPQWRFAARGGPRNPDRMVLDLDPGEGAGLAECAAVALAARGILDGMGLAAVPVTSGSKGIHLYAPLDGTATADEVSAVARALADALVAESPDLVVSDMRKALRRGKVLVDWSQNAGAKTTIAPYSLRGTFRPFAAAPRTWAELEAGGLRQLEYPEVLERLEATGDPFAGIGEGGPLADGVLADDGASDRLLEYRRRRDASRTPEPVPADRPAAPRDGRPTFVIQEHHASSLHWDLRLERDGVLVSWALPKGVPTDPTGNRLAVRTEDHPLEYGTFEGEIPGGEYGAGTVTIWDAGTYEASKWRDGKEVIATLTGRPDGGLGGGAVELAFIRTGGGRREQWLVHLMSGEPTHDAERTRARDGAGRRRGPGRGKDGASTDAEAASSAAPDGIPDAVSPMLATASRAEELAVDWSIEMKWDGVRTIARVGAERLRLDSRSGRDTTATYPEIAGARALVRAGSAVLDGEIVALDARGRPDFGRLQRRMGLTSDADVERARREVDVVYLVFDLLERDGLSLLREPYSERRRRLAEIVDPDDDTGAIRLPPAFDGDAADAIATSRRVGLEGVIAKRPDSRYTPGRRSRSWRKVVHHRTQEVVVVGWRTGSGRRAETLGSLLVAVHDDDGALAYAGRVGTGFDERALSRLSAWCAAHARRTPPLAGVPAADRRDAHWVTPSLVGEARFAGWTDDGRLRHASWRGIRSDKDADEVVREP